MAWCRLVFRVDTDPVPAPLVTGSAVSDRVKGGHRVGHVVEGVFVLACPESPDVFCRESHLLAPFLVLVPCPLIHREATIRLPGDADNTRTEDTSTLDLQPRTSDLIAIEDDSFLVVEDRVTVFPESRGDTSTA
jgi:hypothetical protein